MSAIRTPPHLITLILLTGFSPMSLNMFLPSLANIAGELGTDYGTVSWAVSGYLVVTAVLQLILGPLSDRIGRRPVLLVALFVFTLASVGCVMAQSVDVFLLCRMLQGGVIAGYSLSLAIVRDTRSEQEAVSLIGYIGMTMALAPMLGPILGGVLDAAYGWRTVFLVYVLAGFGLLLLCWFDLGETKPVAGGDGGLQDALPGASMLLRDPLFWAYALCSATSVGAFYIFLTGAPLVAQSVFGVSTAQLGFTIGTITMGFLCGGFVAGRLGKRVNPSTMMVSGRLAACLGLMGGLVIWFAGVTSPLLYFGSTIFAGFGNGVSMPASNAGAMSVQPKLAGSAAGMSGALIMGGGAILTALTGRVVSENSAAPALLALMLVTVVTSLGFAIWAAWLKGSHHQAG